MSARKATVPPASCKTIARFAVGSTTDKVVSKPFTVVPSKTIDPVNTPVFVMSGKFPVVITVPFTFGKSISLSAVGSITLIVVSKPSAVVPSKVRPQVHVPPAN